MNWRRTGTLYKRVMTNNVLVRTVELLAGLSVIVTVVVMWAIYIGQREDAKAMQRKQLAVEMLTLGHNDNIVNAQARVSQFVFAHSQEIHLASSRVDEERSAIALDDPAKAAFLTMTRYYDEVLKCRESDECDAGMIDLWFRFDICGFTEFAELAAYPTLLNDYGVDFGKRLIKYRRKECPQRPV
jgi:hypothetical protein